MTVETAWAGARFVLICWVAIVFNSALLPPGFCLHSVGKAICAILKWDAAHETTQTVRPVRISQECPQHGTAGELAASPDLWRNRELSQPAIELAGAAVGVIGTRLKRQRKVLGKEDLWPGAERYPLVPGVLGIAISSPLENKDRHDGKLVIG